MKPARHIVLWTLTAVLFSACEKETDLAQLPLDQVNQHHYVLDTEGRIKSLQIIENGSLASEVHFSYFQDSIKEISRDWKKNESAEITYYLNQRQEVQSQTRFYFDCEDQRTCYTESQYQYKNNRLVVCDEVTYQIVGPEEVVHKSEKNKTYHYQNGQLIREESHVGDYLCFRLFTYGNISSDVNLLDPRARFLKIAGNLLRTSETDNSCFESNQECQNQYQYEFDDQGRVSGSHYYRKCRDQFSNSTIYHSYTRYSYLVEE